MRPAIDRSSPFDSIANSLLKFDEPSLRPIFGGLHLAFLMRPFDRRGIARASSPHWLGLEKVAVTPAPGFRLFLGSTLRSLLIASVN